jgi:DNA polymerase-3 subunit alpha
MKHSFIHLHLHTEYSITDSTVRIPALMQRCAEMQMPAVALTDQGNLFGMVKFYRQAIDAGIKPIIGVDLRLADHDDIDRPSALVLLCQNLTGYRHLTALLSRTFLEGQHRGVPMAEREWLTRDNCEGLIALSGAMQGDVGRALASNHYDVAEIDPVGQKR